MKSIWEMGPITLGSRYTPPPPKFTENRIQSLSVRSHPLPTQNLVSSFSGFSECFYFFRNGIIDALNYGICSRLRVGNEFMPATYSDFMDLKAFVEHAQEIYLSKNMKASFSKFEQSYIDLAVELMEMEIEKFCDDIAPAGPHGDVRFSNAKWIGDTMYVDLLMS